MSSNQSTTFLPSVTCDALHSDNMDDFHFQCLTISYPFSDVLLCYKQEHGEICPGFISVQYSSSLAKKNDHSVSNVHICLFCCANDSYITHLYSDWCKTAEKRASVQWVATVRKGHGYQGEASYSENVR